MENRKNTILLTVIAVATLLVAVVGATFAYFTAQGGQGAQTPVTVTTSTTSNGSFNTGTAITLTANQEDFYDGAGDKVGTSTANVAYTASGTQASNFCYTVTFDITSNNFVYTTDPTNTPELTFTAEKAANASDLTSPTTLISTKDITTMQDDIQIPTTNGGAEYTHMISASEGQTITDQWRFTVTFVNLDSDQNANTGKSFSGQIKFDQVECS